MDHIFKTEEECMVGEETEKTYAVFDQSFQNIAIIEVESDDLTLSYKASGWHYMIANMGKSLGKWYWEIKHNSAVNNFICLGTAHTDNFALKDYFWRSGTSGFGYYGLTGNFVHNTAGGGGIYGDTYTNGDTIGIALDMDTGKAWFSKNGVWQAGGDPAAGTNEAISGLSGTYYPAAGANGAAANGVVANFGQNPFDYTAPSGFNKGIYNE